MMKRAVVAVLGVWAVITTAVATEESSYAQVGPIHIEAECIEMVSPVEFHAKGDVLITGQGEDIRAESVIIRDEQDRVSIEVQE